MYKQAVSILDSFVEGTGFIAAQLRYNAALRNAAQKWFGAVDAGAFEVKGLASDHTGAFRCGSHG